VRRHVMGEIHEPGLRVDVEDDALHAGDEIVAFAEIRQQRDERDRYRHGADKTWIQEGGSAQVRDWESVLVDIGA